MIVVDVNVIVSAFRSRNGASHFLLREMVAGRIDFALSPAIALEYEDVLGRPGIFGKAPWLERSELDLVLDTLFAQAMLVSPSFRFRPFLDDPKDDIYVECALASGASHIISSDRHFDHPSLAAFGLRVSRAGPFLADWINRRSRN